MEWFVCIDERVVGPLTAEEVHQKLADHSSSPEVLIWGRGQSDWVNFNQWQKSEHSQPGFSSTATPTPLASSQQWHYAINGESKGPYHRAELLHELRNIRDKDQILLWTKGMKAWADLYEFHDILDELGLNRRAQERADITGHLVVTTENGGKIMAQARTISTGGVGGAGLGKQVQMGQNVQIEIQSDALSAPIRAAAQVQYTTELGFVGFKFVALGMEAQSQVLQYLRMHKHNQGARAA